MNQLPDRLRCLKCESIHELTCPDGVPHHGQKRKGRNSRSRWYDSVPCPDCGGSLKYAGLSETRRELAMTCVRLAFRESIRMVNRQRNFYKLQPLLEDETSSDALFGLVKAAELYDPNSGCKFSTYAVHCINSVLYGRGGTSRQLSTTKKLCMAHGDGGVDTRCDDDSMSGIDFFDSLSDPSSPEAESRVITSENAKLISKVMMSLNSKQREIIKARFIEEMSLADIGKSLGVSKERVRQYQVQAIHVARETLDLESRETPEQISRVLEFVRRWPGCTRTALGTYLNWKNSSRLSRLIRSLLKRGNLRIKYSNQGMRLWVTNAN